MNRFLYATILLIFILPICSCNQYDSGSDKPSYVLGGAESDEFPPEATSGESNAPDMEMLENAYKSDPDDPGTVFMWMNALRRAGRINEALDQARILAELEENNPFKSVARLNFADMVLDDIPMDEPGRDELVVEAMDGLWIALGWEPESVPAHKALGRLALEAGDNDKALHHLAIALAVTEIGYELRADMAEIYIGKEDYEKARAHLEIARELADEADNTQAQRRIGTLMRKLK